MTSKESLRPYIAILMYQASGASDLCREDFVLLYAGSEKEAREKAAQRGRQEETSHRNAEGDIVTWSLIHIVDVNEVLDVTVRVGLHPHLEPLLGLVRHLTGLLTAVRLPHTLNVGLPPGTRRTTPYGTWEVTSGLGETVRSRPGLGLEQENRPAVFA